MGKCGKGQAVDLAGAVCQGGWVGRGREIRNRPPDVLIIPLAPGPLAREIWSVYSLKAVPPYPRED